jgi:bacillithiol system protein YtxJ
LEPPLAYNPKSYLSSARSRIKQLLSDPGQPEDGGDCEITSVAEYEALRNAELTVLFKHSPTCGFSRIIHSRLKNFWRVKPEIPFYVISVRQQRELAHYVAKHTGITHESPQVIVFRSGRVIGSASHDQITPGRLTALLELQ